jgi:beta-galactosidase beta subunit
MFRAGLLISTALLILASSQALAWGREGHQIIALIAAHDLKPATTAQVADLLDSPDVTEGMERYSTWADEIRPSRRDTSPWHYVDIELGSNGYDAARDCPNDDCVVGQITRDIAILRDKSLAKPIRAEALRFLIHFVGDLHQPLHCSDNHDRGGNEVKVVLGRRHTNLHAVWDTPVVEALGRDPAVVAGELSSRITAANRAAWGRGSAIPWANECFGLSKRQVYGRMSGSGGTDAPVVLPPDYARRSAPVAAQQLESAGVRLAAILNAVLK